MSRSQLRRLTGVVTAAFVGLMLLGTGVATAAQPGWTSSLKYIPGDAQVAPGGLIAYTVTIKNKPTSRSIITGVNLDTDLTAAAPNLGVPKYVSSVSYQGQTGSGSCSAANTTRLVCQFGSLIVGGSATVTVAFQTPAAGTGYGCGDPAPTDHWCFNFRAFGNGSTPADGGTSHGDYLLVATNVFLNGSNNFAGGFFLSRTDDLSDGQTLGRGNQQNTTVAPPSGFANTALTVEDGTGAAVDCKPSGAHDVGECSSVNVGEGKNYSPALIKITILVYGGAVPGGVSVDDLYVTHTTDGGTTEALARCTFDTSTSTVPNNAPCFKVTKVGSNYKFEIWTPQNGGYRGGYT